MKSLQWGLCLLILILVSLDQNAEKFVGRAVFCAGGLFFVCMFAASIVRERKDTNANK